MYPGHWSTIKPESPALIFATTGETLSWEALDRRSIKAAHLMRERGLEPGDHISLLMENDLKYFEIAWAAYRSGLYITCINRYLTAEEAAYIVNDSGSKALFTSSELEVSTSILKHLEDCPLRFIKGQILGDYESYEDCLNSSSDSALEEEPMGDSMLYSSGTTGNPKGIKRPLTGLHVREGIPGVEPNNRFGINDQTIYLSPAPLYHAAPFGYCMRTLALGGTVVVMDRFDAELSLEYIDKFKVTHSQWVPTMFIRMLKLEATAKSKYDLSSHECAIHAAAPCPKEIKHQMMDWWGPILWEYYAGTERNGSTIISPQEWLENPGSVGKAHLGVLHICDENGTELAAGEEGMVYFEQATRSFEYHNAPEKTSSATHPTNKNWTTLGDVGYLNQNGYLFLTDRKAYMIISGGVNIYPQEIEDAMILHPAVQDVAVFGVPNSDFGEEVKAVIQLTQEFKDEEQLTDDLMEFAREKLAAYKVPRTIDYVDELPRLPTGKLYKRILKEKYWP